MYSHSCVARIVLRQRQRLLSSIRPPSWHEQRRRTSDYQGCAAVGCTRDLRRNGAVRTAQHLQRAHRLRRGRGAMAGRPPALQRRTDGEEKLERINNGDAIMQIGMHIALRLSYPQLTSSVSAPRTASMKCPRRTVHMDKGSTRLLGLRRWCVLTSEPRLAWKDALNARLGANGTERVICLTACEIIHAVVVLILSCSNVVDL